MQLANKEWDAKLQKANDQITMLEAQVNGFANNFETSTVQMQALSISASDKITRLVEGLNNETTKAETEVKKTNRHVAKIDKLMNEIKEKKAIIDDLTGKTFKAEEKTKEAEAKVEKVTKEKQALAEDFTKSMNELHAEEAEFKKKMEGEKLVESNLSKQVSLIQKDLSES